MFTKLHSIILAVLLGAALAGTSVSCSSDDKDKEPEIEVVMRLITNPLPVDSYKQMLSYSAGDEWTITSSEDWLLFTKISSIISGDEDAAGSTTLQGTSADAIVVISLANAEEDTRYAEITLSSGKYSKVLEVSQKGTKDAQVDIGGNATIKAGWMELPQTTETDGFDAYTVRFGNHKRSYTFYWDYDNLVSQWVAYPLNASLIGSGAGRSNAWSLCPLLPSNQQQNVTSAYKDGNNGWYARGHQLPSADRQASFADNAQTFYGVNMTPQNNDFNGALWASLEGKVREWAKKTYTDTLYVVTGCVTTGAQYYVLDASFRRVTVPTGYFKALLLHENSSSSKYTSTGGYAGCAFFFDHEEYSAPGKYNASLDMDMSMSISELETKLGYELFVNLPAKIGADKAATVKNTNTAKEAGTL